MIATIMRKICKNVLPLFRFEVIDYLCKDVALKKIIKLLIQYRTQFLITVMASTIVVLYFYYYFHLESSEVVQLVQFKFKIF